jgi:hypothetical protein
MTFLGVRIQALNAIVFCSTVPLPKNKNKAYGPYPRGADREVSLWGGVLRISVPFTAGRLPRDRTRSRSSCISVRYAQRMIAIRPYSVIDEVMHLAGIRAGRVKQSREE